MASQPARLIAYFVRHGETSANAGGRFRGHSDFPLDENGKAQAQQAANYFKPIEVGHGFSSDLKRSEQTAGIVLDPKGQVAETIQALRPLDVGYLTSEKKANFKQDLEFFQKNETQKIPGGESIQDFRNRVQPILKHIIKTGMTEAAPSISFVHSSNIHEVSHLIHGDHNLVGVKPGGIAAVYHYPSTNKLEFRALTKAKTEDSSHLA